MKTTFIGICAAVMACALPAFGAEPPAASLFFTPEEIQKIETPGQPTASDIHLGAVLYYGPNDWAVWVNGKQITPGTQTGDVKIVGVTSERVQVLLPAGRPVVLRPYQTYQASTGKIVEGP